MADKLSKYSPNEKKAKSGCKSFLWNPDTREILGRTGPSWGKIAIFYVIFLGGLFGLFLLMIKLFSLTLDDIKPTWTLGQSLIGDPGMGFRPTPTSNDSTLIWFKKGDEADWSYWSKELDQYVNDTQTSSDLKPCTLSTVRDEKEKNTKACKVDVTKLGACTRNNNFGYKTGQPCILIKLNKIFGWEPIGFGNPWDWESNTKKDGNPTKALLSEALRKISEPADTGMPIELRKYIEDEAKKLDEKSVEFKNFVNTVWISCGGENPADKENIGPINYTPLPGIQNYYFPYHNQKGYQSPFIMAQLTKPLIGVLINIECKAWAHNITPDRQTRVGSVHLEMLID